jgi:hypothetical protein
LLSFPLTATNKSEGVAKDGGRKETKAKAVQANTEA